MCCLDVSIEAITLAKEHGIVMLTFPPHTSHKLQSLDRGMFGPFKKYYSSACSNWMLTNPGKPITIYGVADNVGKSYPLAFIPVNIPPGFCVSGIWPGNPNVFTQDEYLISSVTDKPHRPINCQNSNFPNEERESNMMELDVYIPNLDTCFEEFCGPSTSNSISCVIPKTKSLSKSNRGGQKQGRILTDTSEKEEIEKQHAIKIATKKKKPCEKI
ncbi:casein kinase I isoform alpha [Trichonephila clavata]|uniref:Casein kinase I isoform alpha n=1 Tax=Trichonephila clavata TaxID=2740835 RepID=A0A8X6FCW0_TRICU|nr:casein kinase I isoform alpha [Trichonephila clavata]